MATLSLAQEMRRARMQIFESRDHEVQLTIVDPGLAGYLDDYTSQSGYQACSGRWAGTTMDSGYARLPGEDAEAHCARLLQLLQGGEAPAEDEDSRNEPEGLEMAEAMLAQKSTEKQSPMVLELLKNLQQCAVYTDTPNSETNRKLWNAYAQSWATDADFVERMSRHVQREAKELSFVGDEWSDAASLTKVLEEWLLPHLAPHLAVAEVGSGGGRISALVAPRVQRLLCFDISEEMLKMARKSLEAAQCRSMLRKRIHLAQNACLLFLVQIDKVVMHAARVV
eukprot:s3036_g2.t1